MSTRRQHVDFLPTLPSLLAAPHQAFIHRDLSWLQFNERVLGEARQASNPLLERVKFLAISASNMDEFFMVRFGSIGRSIQTAEKNDPETAQHLNHVRSSILESVAKFGAKQVEALDLLLSELESVGVRLGTYQTRAGETSFDLGKKVFEEQLLPLLSAPMAFTPSRLSSLDNMQSVVWFKGDVGLVIPRSVPPMVWSKDPQSGETYFFFTDDLLCLHTGDAFRLEGAPGMLRLTRDGDFALNLDEQDMETIPDVVRTGLGNRDRGKAVRLQYRGSIPQDFLVKSAAILKLNNWQVLPAPTTLHLHGLWNVVNFSPEEVTTKPGLKYPPTQPWKPKQFQTGEPEKMFERIRSRDVLLHHPYDAFETVVLWIQACCLDPAVKSIEQTIYRTDAVSPMIEALKAAAKTKKIRVIIELRARFDELNNLRLADELRKAGVEVGFGFGKLKLHAKVALVTREEEGQLKLYTHLSTGNYNASTARMYTDLSILTANPEIGLDARYFFDSVWKGEVPTQFKRLLSAPTRLHRRLIQHIEAETEAAKYGHKARIVAKVNALVDPGVIEHLYKASQAGVQVDLVVRGACSLVPGVQGLSENIRVISIVDRYLEHSRLYYFGHSRAMYVSSADWMPRNFFSRLELAFPVLDPNLYEYLEKVVLPIYLSDSVKAKELTQQGTWKKRTVASTRPIANSINTFTQNKAVRSQFLFEELAAKSYRGTSLEKNDPVA